MTVDKNKKICPISAVSFDAVLKFETCYLCFKNMLFVYRKKVEPLGYYLNSVRLLPARPLAIQVRVRLTGSGHIVITTL